MLNKKTKILFSLLVVGISFTACESDMMQVEPALTAEIEKQLTPSGFDLNELPVISDFSNLRQGDYTGRYLILAKEGNSSKNLVSSIEKAGGEIVKSFPEIGVLVAISISPEFLDNARKISSIESVTPDFMLQYTQEPKMIENEISNQGNGNDITSFGPPFNYRNAIYDGFQWAPKSINATTAWDNGFTGKGIRVAIIDGGIYSEHNDLKSNLDVASSRSTVPNTIPQWDWNQDLGTIWHGTHVAGIVAAAGVGIVGIAPRATIIGVKSLHNGSGAFEWILEGLLYAATPQSKGGAGAQIINMSLGAEFDYRNNWSDKDFRDAFRELQKMYDRATRYAFNNGVTVVVSAGNGSSNFDIEKELFKLPAENQHVISVSSTGPTGWKLGNMNFTDPAYYTDYGKSLVTVAGPGGSAGLLAVSGNTSNCTLVGSTVTLTRPCYAFDMVLSSVRGSGISTGSYSWLQGTSMAAPAVSGVVALMMQSSGGKMQPGLVKAKLASSATDLGKPGKDEYYGAGFVNAAKALGLN
ncbi:subtilase family protein [Algoriphagus ratkowskyi]|uniref:S8 family serine peptidase n=1 Tax=Algoriphagus ratkowskyi TaxID=57028 RepID=A0A2W7R898_9BACT|nr:S8 family serine peptidase [Algoriphagus ratkowskyi]PZX57088.1 subtilase family protein [Algoriphagus ratkowskyi]TXD79982.1 S8 family serine peptidase [Algoriphagus ratkowskyi]